jgi:predicted permease
MYFKVVARIPDGVAMSAVASLLTRGALGETASPGDGAHIILQPVTRAKWDDRGLELSISWLILGLGLIILVTASGNTAALMVARAIQSTPDLAIQLALGASRARLMRQYLLDAMFIVATASISGVVIGGTLSRVVGELLLPGSAPGQTLLDPRAVAIGLAVSGASLLLSVALPAWQMWRFSSGVVPTGSLMAPRSALRWQRILVFAQTGIVFALVASAVLLAQSLEKTLGEEIGLVTDHLAYAQGRAEMVGNDDGSGGLLELLDAARRLPGVQSASIASSLPLASLQMTRLRVRGLDSVLRRGVAGPYVNSVTPGHFANVGMRIVAGRPFTGDDGVGRQPVVVVNKMMAASLWRDASPIGQCIELGPAPFRCYKIIGVVTDVPGGHIRDAPQMQFYVSGLQRPDFWQDPYLLLRIADGARLPADQLRRLLAANRRFGVHAQIGFFADLMAPEVRPLRVASSMVGCVAAVAVILAAAGLYSVTLFAVRRRSREFAIRIAVGAGAGRIVVMLLLESIQTIGVGLMLGALGLLFAGSYMQTILFRVSLFDWRPYTAAISIVVLVSLGSILLPARTIRRLDLRRIVAAE